jgi:site-specific recombinase XerC
VVSGDEFMQVHVRADTRILRNSNLRVVQNLLGHADPSTTARYAHALAEDIRAAMDAANPTKLPTDEVEYRLNSLKKNR